MQAAHTHRGATGARAIGAIGATLALAVSPAAATTFRHIDGVGTASVSGSNWNLSDSGVSYEVKTKPARGTSGMTAPWISGTERFTSGSKAIAFSIGDGWPKDASSMQKLQYFLYSNSAPNASSVKNKNTRFSGFAIKFDSGYTLNNGSAKPIGTQVWQAWQGSGWPPLQLRTDESGDKIRLHFVMSNDEARGAGGTHPTAYLKSGSSDITFNRGQWYTVVIEFKFDYNGNTGVVKAWVNGSQAASWTGKLGYTPASVGGQAGTQDGADIHFGLYQQDTDTNHRVFFDQIKFADTQADATP